MRRARAWLLILALVMVGAAASAAQGSQYQVIRIPIPTGGSLGTYSSVAINDVGQAAGSCLINGLDHAFLWENGVSRDLGIPPKALWSYGKSINNRGQVGGYAYFRDDTDPNKIIFRYRAAVWDLGGWRYPGSLGGKNSYIWGCQRDGTLAVGDSDTSTNPVTHNPCVWDLASAAIINLGASGQAYGISDTREVVGYTPVGGKRIPHLWVPNTTINFALPLPAGATEASATGINRNKVAVGYLWGPFAAVAWFVDLNAKTATVVELTMPVASQSSQLIRINDHCQAVGYFTALDGKSRAILARVPRSGQPKVVDLNGLIIPGSGWELESAGDINNRGEIVGRGKYQGTDAFFLLRPWGLTAPPRYKEVVALPDLGGGDTNPCGLNDSGQVVGYSRTASLAGHAFLWARGYKMQDLGVPKYTESTALSINANGVVAGGAYTGIDLSHAFLWGASFGWEDLGTLGGLKSYAGKINDNNQVAGSAQDTAGHWQPCYWSTGVPFQLSTLGGPNGEAYGINRARTIVGYSLDNTNVEKGCYWLKDEPQPQALPHLPGCDSSIISDVNNIPMPGTLAVGKSSKASSRRPARWNLGAKTVSFLGNLGLTNFAGEAKAINDQAQVVGYSNIDQDTTHAFLVDPGLNQGAMTDLNQLIPADSGWELYNATGLNNRGEIVGYGCNGCQGDAAFYLPVQGENPGVNILLTE